MTKETDGRGARLSPATMAVNGERVAILGWGRAILLQLAHPLVAAGVHEHSRFRGSLVAPVARLHGTIRAMLAFSFGSQEQAAQAAAIINGIHDRVHGRLPHAAGPFPAGRSLLGKGSAAAAVGAPDAPRFNDTRLQPIRRATR